MTRLIMVAASATLLFAGCRSTSSLEFSDSESVFPPRFVQEVSPFEVLGEDGAPLNMPFRGGFNVPRAQFADIDGDGDYDLFVQEQAGRIIFFENTGTPTSPEFTWRTDEYAGLDVGEWFRMLDVDGDGDIDIMSESRYSYIKYWRNEGTPEEALFVVAEDSLKDADGIPIFADRQNIPHLTDIDCDGHLDLFIGRVTGTITRYESVGMDDNLIPRFRMVIERWEDIEIVGENATLHGANTMTFGDIDGDGDEDLLWGDFFEAGLLLIRNQGSCGAPSFRGEPQSFPLDNPVATSGYNAPVLVDIDGDGDLDLFMGVLGGAFNSNATTRDNFYFFEQLGPEKFEVRTARAIRDLDVGSESIVKLADLDGDGDLDMLVGNKIEPTNQRTSLLFYYENVGTATNPAFVYRESRDYIETYHQNPAIADLDADGDLDFLIGKWNREMAYWRNDGTVTEPAFTEVDPVWVALTRGQNTTPVLVDLDGDGDLDLVAGEASGNLNYWENVGTPEEAVFELVSDEWLGIKVGRRAFPSFVDLDGDGDYDMVIGTELDGLQLFENVGTAQSPEFEYRGRMDIPVQAHAAPEWADIDGDGDMDLFVGGSSGGVQFFRNQTIR